MWCRRARRRTATAAQPAPGQCDDGVDDRHPVRPAEQRVWRIMFGHFGFQRRTVGDVGRVGDDEIDAAVQLPKQSGLCHVGAQQLDGCAGHVAPRIGQRVARVVDRDDARVGPAPGQGKRERGGPRAQVDDQRPRRERLGRGPFQQSFGLRPRNEDTRADVNRDGTERGGFGQVLQRDALAARGDEIVVATEEFVAGVRRVLPAWFGWCLRRAPRVAPHPPAQSRFRRRPAPPRRRRSPGAGASCLLQPGLLVGGGQRVEKRVEIALEDLI